MPFASQRSFMENLESIEARGYPGEFNKSYVLYESVYDAKKSYPRKEVMGQTGVLFYENH